MRNPVIGAAMDPRRALAMTSAHRPNPQIIDARSHAATQFRPQLFRDIGRVRAIADDLGTDEDNQFGARSLLGLTRKGIAQPGDFVQQRNAAARSVLLFADQSGQQDGLSGGDRNRAFHPPLRNRRRQAGGRCRRDVAYFLLDIEPDIAVDVDTGRYPQDDASVAIVDGVDDGVVCVVSTVALPVDTGTTSPTWS